MNATQDTRDADGSDGARALVAHSADNVATMLISGMKGCDAQLIGDAFEDYGCIPLAEAIPVDHKVAIRSIAPGEQVIKFGASIGRASAAITAGSHVHVHNLRSERVPGAKR